MSHARRPACFLNLLFNRRLALPTQRPWQRCHTAFGDSFSAAVAIGAANAQTAPTGPPSEGNHLLHFPVAKPADWTGGGQLSCS
jgi:hypothetical protein